MPLRVLGFEARVWSGGGKTASAGGWGMGVEGAGSEAMLDGSLFMILGVNEIVFGYYGLL